MEKDQFILGSWFGGEKKTKSLNATVSWEEIEAVLAMAVEQTGEELIAVFSVRDSTNEGYNYFLQPLGFSPAAMEEAGGKTRLFIYEINPDKTGSVPRIAIAQIPNSELGFKEMKYWIVPQLETGFRQSNTSELKNKSDFYCEAVIEVAAAEACWNEPAEFCSYYQPIYNLVCEGNPSGNNDGGDDPNWDWPMGGGGSNNSGDGSGGGTPSGEDCRPPYGCGEFIYYYGKIEIDNSIFEDAKVTCVLNNLLNNGNTLAETIVKFADESVNLDLVIELVEIQDNSLGNLISQGSNSAFTLQIDKSHAQQQLPIQIATTIMHEAIHAEMRRFLYGATDTSTLPGFPGSFTDDWYNYISGQDGNFNDNVGTAEHDLMAQYYIDIIVDGLKDFDNNSLSIALYEALAWEGLLDTPAYANLNLSQRNRLGSDYQSAINQSSQNCN